MNQSVVTSEVFPNLRYTCPDIGKLTLQPIHITIKRTALPFPWAFTSYLDFQASLQ
jgi:hypothetical protein